MSLTAEAIKCIQENTIIPEERYITIGDRDFIVNNQGEAREINRLRPDDLKSKTLSGMVEYIKNLDYQAEKLYIQIGNEKTVVLYSELHDDNTRDYLMTATPFLPEFDFNRFKEAELLNIELQSKFQANDDQRILLQVIGNIKDEHVQNTSDDGVSQQVTIKQGVASVGAVKVPNPVTLIPFSTFQEIEQPERLFIFRMREGAQGALIATDDTSWKLKAINSIKEYFERELADVKQEVVILA